MTSHLLALSLDANDPLVLARFWGGVLGWEYADDPLDGVVLLPSDHSGLRIRFTPTRERKTDRNRMHFDLTSTSLDDQRGTVERSLGLGARSVDVGQRPEDGHVVLADPEGNEFCVIEPGNAFLAGCGSVGALACDGSQEVGYFWSEALGWPLVWDQDQETAIRSPHGGSKVTWGGPPLMPRAGRDRLRFEVIPAAGADQEREIDRLVSLGAARTGPGGTGTASTDAARDGSGRVVMTDPDGNEFCVLRPGGGAGSGRPANP
ncbi:VOC family protein [Streptomyces sp. NBC_01497]|uniref:VOC family protein n=1 Tax=Streptomyces sp. NBC_01497 TaxID=2903885 RepID=UPI002E36606F|nr:VOC family protein [Streptomyces sp. NBC_01497]